MTIHLETTDVPPSAGRIRRAIVTAITATTLLLITGYAADASIALREVDGVQDGALLGARPSAPTRMLQSVSVKTLHTAMTASPLEQSIFNVAMVREARGQKTARTDAWLALLARLGWRDTQSLQNMLYAAALSHDLPRAFDVGDALLRRQELNDYIVPVMAQLEVDPGLHAMLVKRLATSPSWRPFYLTSTSMLTGREALLARFATIRQLQHLGVPLDTSEVTTNIDALDRAKMPNYGFVLWQSIRQKVQRPLDDTNFELASRSYQTANGAVPYQWQMMTGEGFSASATRDGGSTSLVIEWDGHGVPVFAEQRTSAVPGRYALAVTAHATDRQDLHLLAFRLLCDQAVVAFDPVGPGEYRTQNPVPCAFPLFQVAADVQPSASAHTLSIDRITMTRLPSGDR